MSIKEASQKKAAKDESQVKAEKAAAEAEAKATVPPPSRTPEPTPEPTESEKHYKERAAEAMQKLKGVMEHAHEPTEEEKILKEKLCDAQKVTPRPPHSSYNLFTQIPTLTPINANLPEPLPHSRLPAKPPP